MTKYTWKTYSEPVYIIQDIKPNYNMRFHNANNVEVGVMDFNGGSLSFEGNAEESAIVFMNWINKAFQQRLKEEYDKGFKEGKDFTQNKTSG